MTAQPPLPLAPGGTRLVSGAAAIVEDDDGGRVFVHGNLAYAWDAGDGTAPVTWAGLLGFDFTL